VKRILAGPTVVALALASSGCAMTFDSSHLGVTATMAEPAQAPATGTAFRVTKHPVYLVMGLVPLAQPNLEDLFSGQVGADSAIASLKIHVRSRWTDLLVTVITAGLVVPRSVTYEGIVVGRSAK
jgi:protein-S-isoprenylcysteine O-methyltransferase Ste14